MNAVVRRLRAGGYRVRTRNQWGSKQAQVYGYRLRAKPVDLPVDHMFAHITVTDEDGDAGARQVERIGMDRFGSGVSYNWLVDHETHTIFEGQPLMAKGAHTVNDKKVPGYPENLNYFGHAVAFMAKPGDPFCDECEELFAAIMAASKLEDVVRDEAVYLPHSKFAAKDCPTDVVRDALPRIHKLEREMRNQRAVQKRPKKRAGGKHRKADSRLPVVSLSAVQRDARRDDWSRLNPGAKEMTRIVIEALNAEGFGTYSAWQRSLGYEGKDANGVPGEASLKELGRRQKFRVIE